MGNEIDTNDIDWILAELGFMKFQMLNTDMTPLKIRKVEKNLKKFEGLLKNNLSASDCEYVLSYINYLREGLCVIINHKKN